MKEIIPITSLDTVFEAPPSKAFTLRALFISALANGESVLRNALNAEDQRHAMNALNSFGAEIRFENNNFIVKGTGGKLISPKEPVFCGNSGVTTRFLLPIAALSKGDSVIEGDERMRQRPIEDLIYSIEKAGVKAKASSIGCPPVEVKGESFEGGVTSIRGDKSSQYLSSMLIASPYTKKGLLISVEGELKSKPYVDITIECMKSFGVEVTNREYKEFFVKANEGYIARNYFIEGDYSSASYFFAAAAITNGKVKVTNLNPDSAQGDKFFLDCLEEMGCEVNYGKNFVEVIGKELTGIKVDMGDYPDIVPTLAVVAAFARGKTIIHNVAHLALKESNRLETTAKNLMHLGVPAIAKIDSIEIVGKTPRGGEIETFKDHRIAMSFAIIGLTVKGIKINNPKVVEKSFPNFFKELEKAYLTNRKTNIALIGFRGTGKTQIGRRLAKRLNFKFIDTDKEIIKKEGKSIPDIFTKIGEIGFRELEKKEVKKVSELDDVCIACGGGIVLSKENIENLKKKATVILLEAEPERIYARISRDKNRPALTDKKGIEEVKHLLEERKEKYETSADFKINTTVDSLNECTQKIMDILNEKELL